MDKGGKYAKGIYPRIFEFPNPLLLGRLIFDKEELVFDKEGEILSQREGDSFWRKEEGIREPLSINQEDPPR